ncbi:AAA family ATPase [Chroococcidiopsis sp.]|uniref:AAA family ATPase n=1 Tax=Chroococcidiopsis sp. TaxID=3088168 RepID=UPI003F310A00
MDELQEEAKTTFDVETIRRVTSEYLDQLKEYIRIVSDLGDEENADYIKRNLLNRLEETWVRKLGFSKTQIIADIQDIQTPKTEFANSLGLKEALSYYDPSSSWLIPELLRSEGLYILAGEPKTGKSILMYFLIKSMILTGEFLGRPVRKGRVLFIQLEESLKTISERLHLTGLGDSENEEVSLLANFTDSLLIERLFDITNNLEWLTRKIEEYQPSLVIIDSLRMSQLRTDASENSNEYGKAVYALQQVFNFTGTCGVLIHHMNKPAGRSNSKTGLVERISGHTSISAATDGLIGLYREDPESPILTLKTLPRQGSSVTVRYSLEMEDQGFWRMEKAYEDTPARKPITSKILRFLGQFPGSKFSDASIARQLGVPVGDVEFKTSLRYLVNVQLISNQLSGKTSLYSLPAESMWVINPTSVIDLIPESNRDAIVDANTLMRCSTKACLRAAIESWDEGRQSQAKQLLLADERTRLLELVRSWEYEVGTEVWYQDKVYEIQSIVEDVPSLRGNQYYLSGLSDPVLEIELSFNHGDMEPLRLPALTEDDEPAETLDLEEVVFDGF